MPIEDDDFWLYFGWIIVAMLFAGAVYLFAVAIPAVNAERAARQRQVDTFYVTHHCQKEGYVATRYEPVPTYRCDNGVFITRDMK